MPSAGFRHDMYRDEENRTNVPVLMAAVTKSRMIESFIALIEPLGDVVDVVLETSHGTGATATPICTANTSTCRSCRARCGTSKTCLMNDGCTGIAVLNPSIPQEVQLDEHKLLIVYGKDLTAYERTLIEGRVPCREDMRFITEAEHVHSTCERYVQEFEELKMRLGMDGYR